ncbi:SWIM zinc finger family protein [Paenibacillus terreus]|uniref:SWIM zinc finger family protein n=2 Tax=Paenibacillus terreus TaxID=1387834 RepID=A0ABV5B7U4_9BACL
MNEDIQWTGLVRQVAEHFSDLTIKRGFQYYKQGRVQELSVPDHGPVEAVVQENGASARVSVSLSLDSLEDSECSCGENGGCRHMIAVLLQYAALEERPVYSIVNAHSAGLASRTALAPPHPEAGHASGTGPGGRSTAIPQADRGHVNVPASSMTHVGRELASGPTSSMQHADREHVKGSAIATPQADHEHANGPASTMQHASRDLAAEPASLMPHADGEHATEPNTPVSQAAHAQAKGLAIEDMSAAQWHSLFAQCTATLGSGAQPVQYASQALEAIYAVKPPLAPVLEQLYGLHAHLFVLHRLIGHAPGAARPAHFYLGYHTQIAADEIQAAIRISLSEELAIEGHPEHWNMVTDTLDYLRERMLNESGGRLHYFPDIYYRFWLQWLAPHAGKPEMFLEELRLLEEGGVTQQGSTPARVPRLLARCWMYVFLGRDEEAWRLLQAADGSTALQLPSAQLLLLMSALHGKEEWARLVDGLTAIGPLLGTGSLDEYLAYWRTALEHLPELEALMWDTLTGMLPISGTIYAQALLERGKYRQWMDYQLSTGAEPLDYRAAELQVLERHAPELLLPFYHQAVERHVLFMTRKDYKAAVKLLKRLAKLYKKMKLEDRWESFLASFTSRHRRLRALREELRKGKLLS